MVTINCQFTALDKQFFHRAEKCLSEQERQLFNDYQKVHRQQQFLAGHYLLRVGLTHLLGESEDFWEIGQESGAAPILLNPPENQQVYLSISHSKDQLYCAVSLNNPIGIDIESHTRDRPFIDFAQMYLSQQELGRLTALEGNERKQHFYSLWTVMESVAKTKGNGLGQDILSGCWQSKLEFTEYDYQLQKNGYFTYTTKFDGFTVSIATAYPLELLGCAFLFDGSVIKKMECNFRRGHFMFNLE